jgi:hypothetical protein
MVGLASWAGRKTVTELHVSVASMTREEVGFRKHDATVVLRGQAGGDAKLDMFCRDLLVHESSWNGVITKEK